MLYCFGNFEENMDQSRIHLAVLDTNLCSTAAAFNAMKRQHFPGPSLKAPLLTSKPTCLLHLLFTAMAIR